MIRPRQFAVAAMVLIMALALTSEPLAAQCAMCRNTLASSDSQLLIKALRSGILFLLAIPFSIVGVIGGLVYSAHRRQQDPSQIDL